MRKPGPGWFALLAVTIAAVGPAGEGCSGSSAAPNLVDVTIEGGGLAEEATLDAAEAEALPADAIEPSPERPPDAAESISPPETPDAGDVADVPEPAGEFAEVAEVAEAAVEAVEPLPETAEPLEEAPEALPDVAETAPEEVEPLPEVVAAEPDTAEAIPDVRETAPDAAEPVPDVAADVTPPVPCTGEMCPIPAGTFQMGCNDGTECPSNALDLKCDPDEHPCHAVTVAAFEMDRLEVTTASYGACFDAGVCTAPYSSPAGCNWSDRAGRADYPINCMWWDQAKQYCEWAAGGTKRLCTEAEWERAARGDDGRIYPWGNDAASCVYAVVADGGNGCGTGGTLPVGSRPLGVGPYGVQDLAGNVWEWVEDCYQDSYSGVPTDGSARPQCTTETGNHGLVRGGGYDSPVQSPRASNRHDAGLGGGDTYIGIRCCRSLP